MEYSKCEFLSNVISKLPDEGFGLTLRSMTSIEFVVSSCGGSGKQLRLLAPGFILQSFVETRSEFISKGGLILFVRYGSWQHVEDPV